jgi:DNA-binding response OmpR family regulator
MDLADQHAVDDPTRPQCRSLDGLIKIDMSTFEVTICGELVHLTPLELQLLALLLQNRDQVVSHDAVARAIYGGNGEDVQPLVRQLVYRLRGRMGNARTHLQTAPGLGYVLRTTPTLPSGVPEEVPKVSALPSSGSPDLDK